MRWQGRRAPLSHSEPNVRNDLFVVEALRGRRGGYFVEAGAIDGITSSNTLLLEREYGWTGICVEPDPGPFGELQRNRSCVCVNACLYRTPGQVQFMSAEEGWSGIVEHLAESKRAHWEAGHLIRVPAVTLESLLVAHRAPAVIDYLSLDTEGSEHEILAQFPFERFRFRVVTIERTSCNELLEANGYRRVRNRFNRDAPYEQYFVSAHDPEVAVGWFSRARSTRRARARGLRPFAR